MEQPVPLKTMTDEPAPKPSPGRRIRKLLRALGSGPVTGAADDDPSGIATYSQVGAQFGYQLSWILLFSYPLMAVTQAIAARIGCVTGRGIAQNLRRHYPRWLLRIVVLLLLVANVANLGADLGAMGSAVQLLVGGPALVLHGHPRRLLRIAPDLHELSQIRVRSQMADPVAVFLCRRRHRR